MTWLRERDPGFVALRRAARTAVVMPAMFALSVEVIGNPETATFAAFGSFAMLLFVEFTGPMRDRLQAQAALVVAGAGLVTIGTLASRSTALAVVAMALVAFGVIFAGVVSSVLAGAMTSLLLAFILPVSLPGTASSIPDRLAGWGLAGTASLLAIGLLWPAPPRDRLRSAAITACRALASQLRSEVACVLDGGSRAAETERDAAAGRAGAAVDALDRVFFATPYRPTGLSTGARAVVRLVDELKWLNGMIVEAGPLWPSDDPRPCAVRSAAASALEGGADLLEGPDRSPGELHDALALLRRERMALERGAVVEEDADDAISSCDPSFRAQELSYIVAQIAQNIDFAAAADRRGWVDRLLGRRPAGLTGTLSAAGERAGAHLERHSLWLQNSVRGAVGLGLAVLVARLSGVQHSFWVVLGALSVLRSSALSTGQDVVHALLGTLAGFVAGAAIVALIGTNSAVLWVLLPPAVLLAGLAPATISFAAGQGAFTLTLLIVFNLLSPAGWQVGLVRIQDVALGSAVGLAVGVLFWPRGAARALRVALGEAYSGCASYLAGAVDFGSGRGDADAAAAADTRQRATIAAAASRRLDDTFRTYLAESGEKLLPLSEVAGLITGVVRLRLAADAVLDIWGEGGSADAGGDPARRELLLSTERVTGWYETFAASLSGRAPVPEPVVHDDLADHRLVDAVRHYMSADHGGATATGVRMIWTADHVDAARRLQGSLLGPAAAAALQQ